MGEIRCINKKGKERWLPEKLAKDKAFMQQMELTVQDIQESKKEVEEIILKPEPTSKKAKVKESDGITNG